MPPESRGAPAKPLPLPAGFQSKSTPNLPTLRSVEGVHDASHDAPTTLHQRHPGSPDTINSASEPASLDDFSLDSAADVPSPSHTSTDEDRSEEEGEETLPLPQPPFARHGYSRSHTYLAPSAFAPPFYNRPPTPLPPSPSLTSLLRPNLNFSSAGLGGSRPTTPDPSSDEGTPQTLLNGTATGTQTPNSAAAQSTLTSTFRTAKPIPRASPKVPTYEYYGFTLYLTSSLAFIVYLLWSFLPSPFLHSMGIYYFPDRWWALAIPAWTVMFIVYIYVALSCYNTAYLTLKMDSVECLVDEAANIATIDAGGHIVRNNRSSWQVAVDGEKVKKRERRKHGGHSNFSKLPMHGELDWRTLWNEGTDAVMDIPIGGVCEILYGQADDGDEDMIDE